jgi:hypothetical protein
MMMRAGGPVDGSAFRFATAASSEETTIAEENKYLCT